MLIALFIIDLSVPQMLTLPSSVISILTPVSSIILLITLPCFPTTSPILEGSIFILSIFGANSDNSALGLAIAGFIQVSIINCLASLHLLMAPSTIGRVKPCIFISIWMAVIPVSVPVTLKSISPKKSSKP